MFSLTEIGVDSAFCLTRCVESLYRSASPEPQDNRSRVHETFRGEIARGRSPSRPLPPALSLPCGTASKVTTTLWNGFAGRWVAGGWRAVSCLPARRHRQADVRHEAGPGAVLPDAARAGVGPLRHMPLLCPGRRPGRHTDVEVSPKPKGKGNIPRGTADRRQGTSAARGSVSQFEPETLLGRAQARDYRRCRQSERRRGERPAENVGRAAAPLRVDPDRHHARPSNSPRSDRAASWSAFAPLPVERVGSLAGLVGPCDR